MGCDIHTRIEYFDERESHWLCGDFFRINPYFNGRTPYEAEPYSIVEVCDGRNYDLFATLANVRNYNNNPYIDKPRGIPEDACARTERDFREWGDDAHSASWFTLKELIEWRRKAPETVKRSGYISPEAAEKLDKGIEEPESWWKLRHSNFVYREWEGEWNHHPLDRLIEELTRRGTDLHLWYDWYSKEDVEKRADRLRFIFWFDN